MFGNSHMKNKGRDNRIYFIVSLVLGKRGKDKNIIIGKNIAVKWTLKAMPVAIAKGIIFLTSPKVTLYNK